jgi:hypothetical protein
MKKFILLILIAVFSSVCNSYSSEPPYIKNLPPLSKVPGVGVNFIIPDEEGWMLFDPDGKGSMIVKHGASENESYAISLDFYNQSQPKTVSEFQTLYNILKDREVKPPRYKSIIANENQRIDTGDYFIEFYYLVEDHEASKMPKNAKFMLMETMGIFAVNPEIPDNLVRVAYSHRYLPNNKDNQFREKAKWVLENVTFISQQKRLTSH